MCRIILVALFLLSAISITLAQKQFWGTASTGGLHNNGFIFRTDSIGDNLEIVHHFQSAVDGENIGALLHASNNKLYGLASSGGLNASGVFNGGTFYEYDLATDQFSVIEHFGPSNTNFPTLYLPKAEGLQGLTEVSPGVIYGLMRQGKYVFSYNTATGAVGQPFVLPTYNGGPTNGILQNQIAEAFYKAADGFLYANTYTNSSCPIPNPYMGSIMRVNLANNTITVRHKSSCLVENGFSYNGHLAETNGKLYSTTLLGGASNKGVIFEYTPATNTYVKKHDFAGGAFGVEASSLVVARNGKLYGTTTTGGVPETNLPSGGGVLYEFDLTTNTFVKKHDFLLGSSWVGDMGVHPRGLVNSTNGKLYGVTQYGVFEYNAVTSEIRMAGRFNTLGFAASIVQVCRKPAYQHQTQTTHELCNDAAFAIDLASTNATTVSWKHDNVVDPTKTTPELSFTAFTPEDAGIWVCTLTNECGNTTSQSITLLLNEPQQPAITANGPHSFCAGETITLSAPEGFDGYTWSTGATSREVIVGESGNYTVSVNNGCESPVSEATTITVHPLPSDPAEIEAPTLHTLKAIGTSDVYEWMLDDVILNVQTAEISVTQSGLYKVRSISVEGCRSAGFASRQFQVCSNPGYQYQAETTYEVCNLAAFNLDLAGTNAASIVWKHNDVPDPSKTTSELSFTSFTAADAGIWVCTLTNACGSTTSEGIALIWSEPDQPAITAQGALAFCSGENVTLTAPEGFSEYAWSTGATSRQLVVSEGGDYTVVVSNGCESLPSTPMSVTVHELPASPDGIEELSFDILKATGTGEIYEWTLNDVVLDVQTAEIHAVESGIYKVRSVSSEGCRSSGFASFSFLVTGMETSPESAAVIYPNPGRGILNLKGNSSMHGPAEVSVFNVAGSLVFSQSINFSDDETQTIDLEHLPRGLYQMTIRSSEELVVRKVVISK